MSPKHRWHRRWKTFTRGGALLLGCLLNRPRERAWAMPEDLDETFSGFARRRQTCAKAPPSWAIFYRPQSDTQANVGGVHRRDPGSGNELDQIYAEIVKTAPTLKVAETNVVQAQSDLDQASSI